MAEIVSDPIQGLAFNLNFSLGESKSVTPFNLKIKP